MSRDVHMPISIDDIDIADGRREVNVSAVNRLAKSIDEIGLRHPITVRRVRGDDGRYQLIAGRHRIEACKKLGREHIPAVIVSMTNNEARLWEIAENLHRADLTKLERDTMIAEWVSLTDAKERLTQNVSNPSGGRPGEGLRAAARELGVNRETVRKAVKVAALSDEAKDAARETGLDNRHDALFEAAKQPTVAKQVATIHRIHTTGKVAADPLGPAEVLESQVAALMAAWNKASDDARQEFLSRIEAPVMDRRFK